MRFNIIRVLFFGVYYILVVMISNTGMSRESEGSPDESLSAQSRSETPVRTEGTYVDLYDSHQEEWRPAVVLDRNERDHTYRLQYEGPANRVQTLNWTSERIVPFRTQTAGLPSLRMNAPTKSQNKFVMAEHLKRVEKWMRFNSTPIETQSTHDIRQFIRGTHPFYVEFLLQSRYIDKQTLRASIAYQQFHLEFTGRYMDQYDTTFKKVPNRVNKYYAIGSDEEKGLSEQECCYAHAFPQIFQVATAILGGTPRYAQFIKDNKDLIHQLLDYRVDAFQKQFITGNYQPYYRLLFGDHFFRTGGLVHINKLIARLLQSESLIPFQFVKYVIQLYSALDRTCSTNFRVRCPMSNLVALMKSNINKLSDKDFRSRFRIQDLILDITKKLKAIVAGSYDWQKMIMELDIMEIDTAFKFLKCPIFDRKLKAITFIKDTLERLSEDTLDQKDYNPRQPILCQTTAKLFFQWTNQVGLLEYVLTQSPHPQILKKAAQIIKLFCKTKCLNTRVIDLLWAARQGHEAIARIIDDIIINLVPDLVDTPAIIDHIFSKMQDIPINAWTEELLQLVKKFTLKAIKANRDFPVKKVYGVRDIYKYFLQKKDENSLSALVNILNQAQVLTTTEQIIERCLKMIENDDRAFQHVRLLHAISRNLKLSSLPEVNPIQIVIADIKRYKEQYNNLQKRLDLLDSIIECYYNSITLKKEDMKELWSTLSPLPEAFSILLRHLLKKDDKKLSFKININSEVKDYIFYELICPQMQAAPSLCDQPLLDTFEAFFKDKNESLKYLSCARDYSQFEVINPLKLEGKQSLWKFFMKSVDPSCHNSCELLLDLFTKLSPSAELNREQYGVHLVQSVMEQIRQSLGNVHIMIRSVEFLRRFINRAETKQVRKSSQEELRTKTDNNDSSKKNSVVVKRNPVINTSPNGQRFDEPNYVKRELIKNQKLLIQMLATDAAPKAWSILEQLPFCQQIRDNIEFFTIPFSKIFAGTIYYELYILQFLDKKRWSVWWDQFVQEKGMNVLLNKLTMPIENGIHQLYLRWLTSILVKYYENPRYCGGQNIKDVCSRLLAALEGYLQYLSKRFTVHQTKQKQQQERILAKNILTIIQQNEQSIQYINYPRIFHIVQLALLNENNLIRKLVGQQISKAILTHPQQEKSHKLVSTLIVDLFDYVIKIRPPKAQAYFSFSQNLIEIAAKYNVSDFLIPRLPFWFGKMLEAVRTEKHQGIENVPNDILSGCFVLIRSILMWRPEICSKETGLRLFEEVLTKCLFDFTEGPKCKFQRSRLTGFKLVLLLLTYFSETGEMLSNYLNRYFEQVSWRNRREWQILNKINQKSPTGYVGLENPSCICYMNSFFQQMYMIPSLRQAIFESEDPQRGEIDDGQNLLYQLKYIFVALQKLDGESHDPQPFCRPFKDPNGRPTSIYEQMDVDEFASLLFDRIENQLKNCPDFIKSHFGGVLANEIVGQECPHVSERQEAFLSIPLQVKEKKNVYQSLESMIKGEILDGDNAYDCQKCNKKVKAVKRVSFKHLPNHLIIVLKRLEFNYDTMTKTKLNDYCEFPMELDLQPYSQQFLMGNQGRPTDMHYPNEYFQYELKGTVIHMGFADTGHYYSLIKQRTGDEQWIEFNDNNVRFFDPSQMPEEAFGGQDKTDHIKTQRRKNSYLLIYDRKRLFNKEGHPTNAIERPIQYKHCQKLIQQVDEQNESFNMRRWLFAKDLYEFFKEVSTEVVRRLERVELLKLSIKYFLSILVRQRDKGYAFELAKVLVARLEENKDVNIWLMCLLMQPGLIKQLLFTNPSSDMRKLIGNMMVQLWKNLSPTEDLKQAVPLALLGLLTEKGVIGLNLTNEVFMILVKICVGKPQIIGFLLKNGALGRILQVLAEGELKSYEKIGPSILLPEDAANFIVETKIIRQPQPPTTAQTVKRPTYLESRTYLWYLKSLLLKHCKLINKPSSVNNNTYEPSRRELDLLSKQPYSFDQIQTKLLLRKMCDFWCILATNNRQITEDLLKLIENGILHQNHPRFRLFFMMYKWLANINDLLQDLRVEWIDNIIKAVLEQKYTNQSEIGQQYLLKVIRKNQKIQKHLRGKERCRQMIKLSKIYRDKYGEVCKYRKQFDKSMHPLHGIRLARSQQAYYGGVQKRISDWDSLYRGNGIHDAQDWQSDDDLAEHNVQMGKTIGFFVDATLTYQGATVKGISLDHLELELEKKMLTSWKDCELLSEQCRPDYEEQEAEDSEQEEESSSGGSNDNSN